MYKVFDTPPPQSPIHQPINNRNAQNSLGSLLCIVRQKFKTLMNVVKREKKMKLVLCTCMNIDVPLPYWSPGLSSHCLLRIYLRRA